MEFVANGSRVVPRDIPRPCLSEHNLKGGDEFFYGENMREHTGATPIPEIRWPQESTIEIGPEIDFVYAMRKDGKFSMAPIAHKMATEYRLDEEKITQMLCTEYDKFVAKLVDIFIAAHASKGSIELHLFDPDTVARNLTFKASGKPLVSLDPLMNQGVQELGLSRSYFLSGKSAIGLVARPGYRSLPEQSRDIATSMRGHKITVVEDDIYTGSSAIGSLQALSKNGVDIEKVVPGIQVGIPTKLIDLGYVIHPVISYVTTDEADIFKKVDIGDPRDFLLGASGLVIQLPNGGLGRAPYLLPLVSATARAGIPTEKEKEFSLLTLRANLEFFKAIEDTTNRPLLLKHMDRSFQIYLHQMYGVDLDTEMGQIAIWLMDNLDGFWEITKKQGEFQEQLGALNLPKRIVFLDVNGTLFPDSSIDGHIAQADRIQLKQAIAAALDKGISVGLCSDSPLPQLQGLATQLGINGPIIAENGNILFHDNHQMVLQTLTDIEHYKSQIQQQALALGLRQVGDNIAPEFGGMQIDTTHHQWSFGANRTTSISVFGPPHFVNELTEFFHDTQTDLSIDSSPDYTYFALHPGKDFRINKGLTLDALSEYGHTIVMVGNSMSDWVPLEHGVVCTFVEGANINETIQNKAGYVAEKPTIQGVIEILGNIQ